MASTTSIRSSSTSKLGWGIVAAVGVLAAVGAMLATRGTSA